MNKLRAVMLFALAATVSHRDVRADVLPVTGTLNIGWSATFGTTPTAEIYNSSLPGGSAWVYLVPFEVKSGSWLPAVSSLAPAGFNKNDFYSFCTDINIEMKSGDNTYTAARFAPAAVNYQKAEYLYVHNYTAAFNIGVGGTTVNPLQAAALQLAIWEALYENPANGYSLTDPTGAFHADFTTHGTDDPNSLANSGVILGDAASYLAQLTPGLDLSPYSSTLVDGLNDPKGPTQSLLGMPTASVVDSGTTLTLLGMALTSVSLFRRQVGK